MDDFNIAGDPDFVEKVVGAVKGELTISKREDDVFRFTGVDVRKTVDGIKISMNDYAESIEKIKEFRPAKRTDPLMPAELKLYRGYTGKISWLADNVRPDLSYTALEMAKKGTNATMADLRKVNHIVDKVKDTPSEISLSKISDNDEELQVIGIGDASYKWDDKSVGGIILMISNKKNHKSIPVFWKSKQIARSVHSSKDAELLNLAKLVDDSVFLAQQLEILLYGKYEKKIEVKLFTDSEPTLESIASSKPVETKRLRNQVQELKDVLTNGEITSIAWLSTNDMLADGLTKERKMNEDMKDLVSKNVSRLAHSSVNEIRALDDEIRMFNIRNRKSNLTEVKQKSRGNVGQ